MSTNRKRICVAAIVVVIVVTITGIIMYNTSDTENLKRQLELGQKYLLETNYEEAIVAFNLTIEIDPMNVDAYLGLAEAYLGLGDIEGAKNALNDGYEITDDERIKEYIDEMKSNSEEVTEFTDSGFEETVDNLELSEDVKKIIEIIRYVAPMDSTHQIWANYLTYEQLEAVYWPSAELLKKYLAYNQNDKEAWEALAWIYLHMDEMELCLEVRREGYEITGYENLIPETYTKTSVNADITYDEYGRRIEEHWAEGTLDGTAQTNTYTYGEGDRYITYVEESSDNSIWRREAEYDTFGRIIRVTSTMSFHGGENEEYYFKCEYEYEGDNSVLYKSSHSSGDWQIDRVIYDEYGKETDRTIEDSYVRH